MTKKQNRNTVVILIIIGAIALAIFGFNTLSITPNLLTQTAYGSWSNGGLTYSGIHSNQDLGFANVHVFASDNVQKKIDLSNAQSQLNKNDYTCKVEGTTTCIGGAPLCSPDRTVSHTQVYSINGIIELVSDEFPTWACTVNRNDLLNLLPDFVTHPDGVHQISVADSKIGVTGNVIFELGGNGNGECVEFEETCGNENSPGEGLVTWECNPNTLQFEFQGFEIGKCGVECFNDGDCNNMKCEAYKCVGVQTPIGGSFYIIIIGFIAVIGGLYWVYRNIK